MLVLLYGHANNIDATNLLIYKAYICLNLCLFLLSFSKMTMQSDKEKQETTRQNDGFKFGHDGLNQRFKITFSLPSCSKKIL